MQRGSTEGMVCVHAVCCDLEMTFDSFSTISCCLEDSQPLSVLSFSASWCKMPLSVQVKALAVQV